LTCTYWLSLYLSDFRCFSFSRGPNGRPRTRVKPEVFRRKNPKQSGGGLGRGPRSGRLYEMLRSFGMTSPLSGVRPGVAMVRQMETGRANSSRSRACWTMPRKPMSDRENRRFTERIVRISFGFSRPAHHTDGRWRSKLGS